MEKRLNVVGRAPVGAYSDCHGVTITQRDLSALVEVEGVGASKQQQHRNDAVEEKARERSDLGSQLGAW